MRGSIPLRNVFYVAVWWFVAKTIAGLAMGPTMFPATANELVPNVVMMIADDMAFDDFRFMGNEVVQTPHLDRLAARSARFTHGYVPSSVCRPSLATLLTGLYPHQHGVHFNHPPPGFSKSVRTMDRSEYEQARRNAEYLIGSQETLPRRLAKVGYRCLQTGKHWEGDWRTAGFTEGMTTGRPVDGARYGNKRLANGQWVAHGNGDAGLAIGRQTMQPIADFIQDVGSAPYLIWYAPFLPHLPHDSPKPYYDRYDASLPQHLRAHYAACSQFDWTIGELMRLVDQSRSERPTLYVLISDNGFRPDPDQPMKDGHGFNYTRRSKRSPFEDGLRTPILFSLDGETKPSTHAMLCSSVDVVPTVLNACGLKIPDGLPGRSLWPVATGRVQQLPQRPVFGGIYPGDASVLGDPEADVAYRWAREGDFKLIMPSIGRGRNWGDYVDSTELYNLAKDPGERQNLTGLSKHEKIRDRLERQIRTWWRPIKRVAENGPAGASPDGRH